MTKERGDLLGCPFNDGFMSLLSVVGVEDQSLGAEVNFDFVAFFELALQYLLGQRGLHLTLLMVPHSGVPLRSFVHYIGIL
jgi:hypothetical protein